MEIKGSIATKGPRRPYRRVKAQSDLAGDGKSAAEMTAPRVCAVTTWMNAVKDANGFMFDLNPSKDEIEAIIAMNDFKPDLSLLAETLKNEFDTPNFSEVNHCLLRRQRRSQTPANSANLSHAQLSRCAPAHVAACPSRGPNPLPSQNNRLTLYKISLNANDVNRHIDIFLIKL